MSLTFTDWTACTDDGTGQAFALNWTADTGLLPWIHLEAIRQAIAERYAAAGLTLTGVLASPLAVGSVNLYGIGTAIDAAITALIPAYVNHLDNGGDWEGQTTCAPVWTSATILAAIGVASRITVGNLGTPLSAAWARQVYALINLLRWAIGFYDDYQEHGFVTNCTWDRRLVQYSFCPSWAALEAKWVAEGVWVPATPYEWGIDAPPYSTAMWNPGNPGGAWSAMYRFRESYNCVGTANNKTIEIYYRLEDQGPSTEFMPDSWAPAAIPGHYYKCADAGVSTADASFSVGPVTPGDGIPLHGADPYVDYGFTTYITNRPKLISKNNIPGGFTFQ
jgi:hypothetical protein